MQEAEAGKPVEGRLPGESLKLIQETMRAPEGLSKLLSQRDSVHRDK